MKPMAQVLITAALNCVDKAGDTRRQLGDDQEWHVVGSLLPTASEGQQQGATHNLQENDKNGHQPS
jgi:hypothetical protein